MQGLKKPFFDNIFGFGVEVRSSQLLLPAEVVVDCIKFETCSMRLLTKSFQITETAEIHNLTVNDLFAEAKKLYDSIMNQMRHAARIDALSRQVLEHLNNRTSRKWLFSNVASSHTTNPNPTVEKEASKIGAYLSP